MCGRYTLKTNPELWAQLLLPLTIPSQPSAEPWKPRYNIAPTQSVLALSQVNDCVALETYRWGLLPFWASDLSIGGRMINARSETLAEKRSFAKPLESQRCLVIADGYYEWQKLPGGGKRPTWISPAHGGLVLLAGLWATNRKATDATIQSCTLITTAANAILAEIHDRMPVVIDPLDAADWLDPHRNGEQASELLASADDDYFRYHEVSTLVNSPKNDSAECIAPVETDQG